jgi:hypothetical protein
MTEDKLYKIELQIDKSGLKIMRSSVTAAYLCESGGAEIEIIKKICQAIEEGEEGLILRARK